MESSDNMWPWHSEVLWLNIEWEDPLSRLHTRWPLKQLSPYFHVWPFNDFLKQVQLRTGIKVVYGANSTTLFCCCCCNNLFFGRCFTESTAFSVSCFFRIWMMGRSGFNQSNHALSCFSVLKQVSTGSVCCALYLMKDQTKLSRQTTSPTDLFPTSVTVDLVVKLWTLFLAHLLFVFLLLLRETDHHLVGLLAEQKRLNMRFYFTCMWSNN